MKVLKKVYSRIDIMRIIEAESDNIKKSSDRMRYWKKVLKDLDRNQVRFPIQMGGEL